MVPRAITDVYAVWKERQKLTISFDGNGGDLGSLPASKEVYEREALEDDFPAYNPTNVANMDPKKPGYTFIGWGYDKSSTMPEVTRDTVFTESETLYAIWKEGSSDTITVKFDANGGSYKSGKMPSETFEKGTALGARFPTEIPEKPDKKFLGYAYSASATEPDNITPETIFNDGADVYAVWVDDYYSVYKVEFDMQGSKPYIASLYVMEDKALGDRFPKITPRKKGYEFVGYTRSREEAQTGEITAANRMDGSVKITSNTVVYAAFKKKEVSTITFNSNGGAGAMDVATVDKGSSYTLPISKFMPPAGMEFDKWSVTVGSAQAVDRKPGESIVASDNVVVKAVWKAKEVPVMAKVTLHADGVSGYPKVIEVKRGETLGDKLPETIEKAGFDFLGYSKENNGDINFFSDTAVKEDMNVYAVYKSQAPVAKKVENIRLTAGSLRMQLGDLTDILAIVSPSDATDKRVKFTLDRADILKVVSADDSAAKGRGNRRRHGKG